MKRLIASILSVALVAGCTRAEPGVPTGLEGARTVATLPGFSILMEREGGIGTLYMRESMEGETRRFVATTHRICSVPHCQAAMDSASGALPFDAAIAIAAAVDRVNFWALKDDYGRTPNSADMMDYRLTIRSNGRSKTVRGDDGTFPDQAREVQNALHAAITAARQR
jgi:hypothetical protein